MSTRTPLYGHVSEETAYHNENYPYGPRLHCLRLCWIEYKKGRGYRFCYRTFHPIDGQPVAGKPNAIKRSTYNMLAGNLYLDENRHTQWAGLTEYSDHAEVAAYVRDFPLADLHLLQVWVRMKIKYYTVAVEGKVKWTVNDIAQEPTEADIERYKADLAGWESILPLLPVKEIV